MSALTVEDLRGISLFAGVDDEGLRWLARRGGVRELAEGEALFVEGDEATHFYVVLDGLLEGVKDTGAVREVVGRSEAGGFIGAIPLLAGEPYRATLRAVRPSRLGTFDEEAFFGLVSREPKVTRELLRVFGPNFQRWERVTAQREKLSALGAMAAGLAHELNNPAAAARRATGELRDLVGSRNASLARLAGLCRAPEAIAAIGERRVEALDRAAAATSLDALDAGDREDELGGWLEERGVEAAWDLTPTLVEADLDVAWLERVAEAAGPDVLPDALAWIVKDLSAVRLLSEIDDATARISQLVGAIKEYSYMDRAPEQDVDVHDGIESTLTMLGHRLKQGHVRVVRAYDRSLPSIPAYGSELNQVWTNLLVNALDALDGEGTVTIRTTRDVDHLLVEVADDGPGIPEDVVAHIFEPFFTTKGVGQGTGLGLDVANRVVHDRHGGGISVDSRPGDTRFQVRLPFTRPPRA